MLRILALAAGLAALAGAAIADEPVSTIVLLQSATTNTRGAIAYPATDSPEITVQIVEIAPGGSTVRHTHSHPLVAYVLEGTLEVVAEGGVRNRYEAGDSFLETIGTVHQGFNVGEGPLRILVTNIGVKEEPNAHPVE